MDIIKRVARHQEGKGAKYTRSRLPVELVFVEEQPDRSSAMRRERQIKRMPRQKKLELIQTNE